ncbi:MAG TPA: hypothetical protein VF859_12095 [Burkholderiales bacterium]
MFQPKTMDEYIDLVHEAIYEIDELRLSVEESSLDDEWEQYRDLLEPLDIEVRKLYEELISGAYRFRPGEDLTFMPLVQRLGKEVPVKPLLEAINYAHRHGL